MIENKARIAANGGTIATSVLIYMAIDFSLRHCFLDCIFCSSCIYAEIGVK